MRRATLGLGAALLAIYTLGFFLLAPIEYNGEWQTAYIANRANSILYFPLVEPIQKTWISRLWVENRLFWCPGSKHCKVVNDDGRASNQKTPPHANKTNQH